MVLFVLVFVVLFVVLFVLVFVFVFVLGTAVRSSRFRYNLALLASAN